MSDGDIKNIPSFKKLRDNAQTFRDFGKAWPFLKHIAKALRMDTKGMDEALREAAGLAKQSYKMTAIPDKFNNMFTEIGWIFIESMELEAAEQAILIAEKDGTEMADKFLSDYFSPDWVEVRINRLKYAPGFEPRFDMASKALEDYKAGRYYASILVTIALMDGWVSELNVVNFHRLGFFSEKSELVAWDSIAAHPKGLMKLKDVFGKPRLMTRSEEITVPYRHGIMHGMDLGYDNKYVAAKCWAALFAVREWAIKVAKEELRPPELEPEKETSLWESLERFRKSQEEIERLRHWQPRQVAVGVTIPTSGTEADFPEGTPEQKMVEFLNYWLKNNYGYMAKCFAPMLHMEPIMVRNNFQSTGLIEYELIRINDVAAFITDIEVRVRLQRSDNVVNSIYEFRLALTNKDGELAYIPKDEAIWGITTWRLVE